jgi:hypothetical protein
MPRNDAATPDHARAHIGIQTIDIIQPPGIGIPPDIDVPHTTVITTQPAKSAPEIPRNIRSETRPETMHRDVAFSPAAMTIFTTLSFTPLHKYRREKRRDD